MKKYLHAFLILTIGTLGWLQFHTATNVTDDQSSFQWLILDSRERKIATVTKKGKTADVKTVITAAPLEVNVKIETKNLGTKQSLEIRNTFQVFHALRNKTFLTPKEESTYAEILRDPQFLMATVSLFLDKNANLSPFEINGGVDLLLESLRTNQKNLAQQIILTIIADTQIENSKLNSAARIRIAGIKAELMFHAVEMNPQTVKNALPGPVTEKIWNNVLQAQAQNLAESANEQKNY